MFYALPTILTLVCFYGLVTGRHSYHKEYKFNEDAEIHFPDFNDNGDWEFEKPSHSFSLPKYVIQPKQDYSYTEHGGATNWPNDFPECGGDQQSPINIDSSSIPRKHFKPISLQHYWNNKNPALLNNTGKYAKLTLHGNFTLPTLSGGPLSGEYTFDQLHFHWGPDNGEGSEHTVDLEPFSMEAHVVHFKTKYGSVTEAAKHKDGLAVVAFFLQAVKHRHNKPFSDLVDNLQKVRKALSTVKLPSASTAFGWFRDSLWGDYVTYSGSLTTPPCNQVVTWIVHIQPILVAIGQVDEFRTLRHIDGSKIKVNYRPVQRYIVPDLYGPIL